MALPLRWLDTETFLLRKAQFIDDLQIGVLNESTYYGLFGSSLLSVTIESDS